jgi:hypothetical protein
MVWSCFCASLTEKLSELPLGRVGISEIGMVTGVTICVCLLDCCGTTGLTLGT